MYRAVFICFILAFLLQTHDIRATTATTAIITALCCWWRLYVQHTVEEPRRTAEFSLLSGALILFWSQHSDRRGTAQMRGGESVRTPSPNMTMASLMAHYCTAGIAPPTASSLLRKSFLIDDTSNYDSKKQTQDVHGKPCYPEIITSTF